MSDYKNHAINDIILNFGFVIYEELLLQLINLELIPQDY